MVFRILRTVLDRLAERRFGTLLITCLLASFALSCQAKTDGAANDDNDAAPKVATYDTEAIRKVTTVLPADLVSGETWKLGDTATPYQGLFQFQLVTQWGDFPIYGEALLRLRLKEFRAVAELQKISNTEAGLAGAGKSMKKSAKQLGQAIVHPKQTARALPQGTRRLFSKLSRYHKKAKEALKDSGEEKKEQSESAQGSSSSSAEKAAVWLARKYGGVGSKTRRRALDAGVDPYTSNELLASELERLSRAEAKGSIGSKFLMPVMAASVGLVADAAKLAYTQDWREVFKHNAQLMRDMGVSEQLILDFEVNKFYTPMTQTLLIAILDSIKGAQNRWIAIEQASLLKSEPEALFYLESIMLAQWYHQEQAPLEAFVPNTLIPVARNKHNNLVAFTAADFFYWTQESEKISRDFTAAYADYPGGRELVMADYISPLARKGVEAQGWSVRSGLRQSYDVEIPWGVQDHK